MAFGYVLKALDISMVIFSHRSVKGAYLGGDIVVSRGEIFFFYHYITMYGSVCDILEYKLHYIFTLILG
jgi:hypothetical protein